MVKKFIYDTSRIPKRLQTIRECDSLSALYSVVPFQFFASVRPVKPNSMEFLQQIVKTFFNSIERFHKAPVSAVTAFEMLPFPNVHIVLASMVPLDPLVIDEELGKRFKPTEKLKISSLPVDKDVQRVNNTVEDRKHVLEYIFNKDAATTEWSYRNMDFYLGAPTNDATQRRRSRRSHQRVEVNRDKLAAALTRTEKKPPVSIPAKHPLKSDVALQQEWLATHSVTKLPPKVKR